MAQQKGVVLYCKGREPTEIEIPQPRGTPGGLHPPDYGYEILMKYYILIC